MTTSSHQKNTIILGGGCFWCVEAVFQMLRGVVSVRSGYAGGSMKKPSYHQVSSGATGHAEVIEVTYDPSIITLEDLLAVFFTSHDPTTPNRQGNDIGTQYRSVIYYTNREDKPIIERYIQKLTQDQVFHKPIVTEVQPLDAFYEAETYHQNYYKNNQEQPYCQFMIDPKVAKIRKTYTHLLRPEEK